MVIIIQQRGPEREGDSYTANDVLGDESEGSECERSEANRKETNRQDVEQDKSAAASS